MRWLGDASVACSQALPLDGCPRFAPAYLGRKRRGRSPPKLLYPDQGSVIPGVKAFEKNHFQPRYAGANLGRPSRGQGLLGRRESGGRKDSQPPNRGVAGQRLDGCWTCGSLKREPCPHSSCSRDTALHVHRSRFHHVGPMATQRRQKHEQQKRLPRVPCSSTPIGFAWGQVLLEKIRVEVDGETDTFG
jgi:hypothetical protein